VISLDPYAMRWRKSSRSAQGGDDCVEVAAARWRKSSRSAQGGQDCVEVAAARWLKSSHSSAQGGQCVELAGLPGVVAVRDSKDPDGPKLAFAAREWAAFVAAVKTSRYDGS
jgi:hypothetical protein